MLEQHVSVWAMVISVMFIFLRLYRWRPTARNRLKHEKNNIEYTGFRLGVELQVTLKVKDLGPALMITRGVTIYQYIAIQWKNIAIYLNTFFLYRDTPNDHYPLQQLCDFEQSSFSRLINIKQKKTNKFYFSNLTHWIKWEPSSPFMFRIALSNIHQTMQSVASPRTQHLSMMPIVTLTFDLQNQ